MDEVARNIAVNPGSQSLSGNPLIRLSALAAKPRSSANLRQHMRRRKLFHKARARPTRHGAALMQRRIAILL